MDEKIIDQQFQKLLNIYKNSHVRSMSFAQISPLINAPVLAKLFSLKRPKVSLKKLAKITEAPDHYTMLEAICKHRAAIPPEVLLQLYISMLGDRSNTYYQEIRTAAGDICTLGYSINDPEIAEHPITSELLIDHPVVLIRYSQLQKPGWETLRYAAGLRRSAKQKLPEAMRQAISNDCVEQFLIYKDISGKQLSYSLLVEVLEKKAFKIFTALLKSDNIFNRVISLEELCFCLAGSFEDSISVPALEAIEAVHPGTLKRVRDRWGRNLLWYCVSNKKTAFFHPFCRLTEFLINAGCDVNNRNQLDFSFAGLYRNISTREKEMILTTRYIKNEGLYRSPLKQEQPYYALLSPEFLPEWAENLHANRCPA